MEARTINVPVRVPKSYCIDLLQQHIWYCKDLNGPYLYESSDKN